MKTTLNIITNGLYTMIVQTLICHLHGISLLETAVLKLLC